MMHGREKSDSAIVAGKPTNKAGQPAAEPVEPRAEAKGNASQQRTRRTQSRVSVSHALERIRQTGTKKTLCRHTPKVGAVCPNWARTDLCGGRSVMSVPTAISEMSSQNIPLKDRTDLRESSRILATETITRLSCGGGGTQLGPNARIFLSRDAYADVAQSLRCRGCICYRRSVELSHAGRTIHTIAKKQRT
jgi:hypothetical protein